MSLTGEDTKARRDALGPNWRGVYCILPTPFNKDYSIDWPGLRTNVEFIAGAPVDVVVCMGTGGEPYALADHERTAIVEVVAEELRGRRPLIVGVSHSSTLASVQLARHAVQNGCDAVLTTAPYYVEIDDGGLRRHLVAVSEAGASTFFYNVPQRVAYQPSSDEILDLADRIPLSGIKESSVDPALGVLLANRSRREFVVIGGRETTMWQSLTAGADGNTSTAASALPKRFAAIWEASHREDKEFGRSLFEQLEPLRRAYATGGGQVPVTKRLLELCGLAGGPPRPPLIPADRDVDVLLRELLAVDPL